MCCVLLKTIKFKVLFAYLNPTLRELSFGAFRSKLYFEKNVEKCIS